MGKKLDELRKRLKRLEKQVAAFLSPKPAKPKKGKPKTKKVSKTKKAVKRKVVRAPEPPPASDVDATQ